MDLRRRSYATNTILPGIGRSTAPRTSTRKDCREELLPYRAEMVRLFHVLHLLGIEQQRKAHEFKRAKRDYLANQMPNLRKWLNRSVDSGLH